MKCETHAEIVSGVCWGEGEGKIDQVVLTKLIDIMYWCTIVRSRNLYFSLETQGLPE